MVPAEMRLVDRLYTADIVQSSIAGTRGSILNIRVVIYPVYRYTIIGK